MCPPPEPISEALAVTQDTEATFSKMQWVCSCLHARGCLGCKHPNPTHSSSSKSQLPKAVGKKCRGGRHQPGSLKAGRDVTRLLQLWQHLTGSRAALPAWAAPPPKAADPSLTSSPSTVPFRKSTSRKWQPKPQIQQPQGYSDFPPQLSGCALWIPSTWSEILTHHLGLWASNLPSLCLSSLIRKTGTNSHLRDHMRRPCKFLAHAVSGQ